MNIRKFKEALPYLFQANISTMVCGWHGLGKSQAVKQYAEENDMEFVDLRLGTQDVGDLLGLADFVTNPKTGQKEATKFMRPDWFPTSESSKGIIFLDEINRARRDVLQAVFQLCLDKRLHRYELPKGWQVIAAMNPGTSDYITTDISDKAFMDRFCHIKFAPSKQEFFDYLKKSKAESVLTTFLQEQPEMIQGKLEDFSLDVTPSRRSWEAVDRLLKAKTPVNILQDLVAGLVGTTAAVAFIKSMSDSDKPISGTDVLTSFEKFAKKFKEYSNAKTGGRQDLIKYTCDSLLEVIQGRTVKTPLTPEESKNLADFLVAIPKDVAFDLTRNLYMEEVARPVIDGHKELLKMLANARNMKVEGLNT